MQPQSPYSNQGIWWQDARASEDGGHREAGDDRHLTTHPLYLEHLRACVSVCEGEVAREGESKYARLVIERMFYRKRDGREEPGMA